MKQSVQDALDWLYEDPRRTPYKAAKRFDIQQSTLTRALRLVATRSICPECGNWKHTPNNELELPKKHGGKVDTAKILGNAAEEALI